MADINEPNYVHYSRLKTINLDEAASLLAHFELMDKKVTDPDEYAQLFNGKERLANKVLFDANMCNALNCFRDDGIPTDILHYYKPELMMVNMVEFCKWAIKSGYKLPDELTVLPTALNEPKNNQGQEAGDNTPAGKKEKKPVTPISDNAKTIDGLLKMFIAMAMDCYGYDPADRKSTTVSDIMNALAKCDLSVSENTIRDRLKQAQLLLPRK